MKDKKELNNEMRSGLTSTQEVLYSRDFKKADRAARQVEGKSSTND